MSSIAELEQLQRKRVELKNELKPLEETERALIIRMKVLEEKLAIRMLEKQIKAKGASVEELRSRIRGLQNRLGEPQKKAPSDVTVKTAPSNRPVAQTTSKTA